MRQHADITALWGRASSPQPRFSGRLFPQRGQHADARPAENYGYNSLVSAQAEQRMQCMEVWGGSQLTTRGVAFGGLDAWVYSKPHGDAEHGGDVYYASSCATGRIARLLLA